MIRVYQNQPPSQTPPPLPFLVRAWDRLFYYMLLSVVNRLLSSWVSLKLDILSLRGVCWGGVRVSVGHAVASCLTVLVEVDTLESEGDDEENATMS
jgi:hypothetical protein